MQQPANESDADLSSGASAMLPKLVDEVFLFFARENLPDHHPPWLDFRTVKTPEELAVGSLIRYRLRWHRAPVRCEAGCRGDF
jgi:hypothetical protein